MTNRRTLTFSTPNRVIWMCFFSAGVLYFVRLKESERLKWLCFRLFGKKNILSRFMQIFQRARIDSALWYGLKSIFDPNFWMNNSIPSNSKNGSFFELTLYFEWRWKEREWEVKNKKQQTSSIYKSQLSQKSEWKSQPVWNETFKSIYNLRSFKHWDVKRALSAGARILLNADFIISRQNSETDLSKWVSFYGGNSRMTWTHFTQDINTHTHIFTFAFTFYSWITKRHKQDIFLCSIDTQKSKSQSTEYLANDVIRNSANRFQFTSETYILFQSCVSFLVAWFAMEPNTDQMFTIF